MKLKRRTTRTKRTVAVGLTAAVAALLLATQAIPANADTLQGNGLSADLGTYPLPATAPSLVGDGLPTVPGTLGNPVNLFVKGASASYSWQVLEDPNDSSSWGNEAMTNQSNSSNAQKWYFQNVGTLNGRSQIPKLGFPGPITLYKMVHYTSDGQRLCLDALGGSGASMTHVGLYGCDPNATNQPNQIWAVIPSDSSIAKNLPNDAWEGQGDLWPQTYTEASGSYTIINLDTILQSGAIPSQAYLSAGVANVNGVASTIQLRPRSQFPVSIHNTTWRIDRLGPPVGTKSSPSDPGTSCTGFACILN